MPGGHHPELAERAPGGARSAGSWPTGAPPLAHQGRVAGQRPGRPVRVICTSGERSSGRRGATTRDAAWMKPASARLMSDREKGGTCTRLVGVPTRGIRSPLSCPVSSSWSFGWLPDGPDDRPGRGRRRSRTSPSTDPAERMLRIASGDSRIRNRRVDHRAEGSPHGRKAGRSGVLASGHGHQPVRE